MTHSPSPQPCPALQRSSLLGVRLGAAPTPVDIDIEGALIADIRPAAGPETGGVLLPLFVDSHVHLDKTYTVERTGAKTSGLIGAINAIEADRPNWTQDDLRRRANAALERAWRHGTGAMRSHVDWMSADIPLAWDVLTRLRNDWRGRLDMQLASLTPLDDLVEHGEKIAAQVKRDDGVLGAFVYREEKLADKIGHVFDLADRFDLPLDFHVDERLDAGARGFDEIVRQAEIRADGPPVLVGHGCALSVRPEAEVKRLFDRAAKANIGLVVLPSTNAYLQDVQPGRTPRLRGIAPVREASAAGLDVLIASDNVGDVFYPYGDYDLLDVYRHAILLAQIDASGWLPAIGANAARWTGLQPFGDLRRGDPADFVHIAAPGLIAAISRPSATRTVWRNGMPLTEGKVPSRGL